MILICCLGTLIWDLSAMHASSAQPFYRIARILKQLSVSFICPFFSKGRVYDCSTGRSLTSRSAWRETWGRWRSCRCTGCTTTRSTPSTSARSVYSSAPIDSTQTSWSCPRSNTRTKGASMCPLLVCEFASGDFKDCCYTGNTQVFKHISHNR